jgi:hypothetical protein
LHNNRDNNNSKGNDGKMEKEGNQSLHPHNKLVQEPDRNEENRYSDPDSNKTKIKYAKEPNEANMNTLKEEYCKVIMRIL